jgi:hypothetical protein
MGLLKDWLMAPGKRLYISAVKGILGVGIEKI